LLDSLASETEPLTDDRDDQEVMNCKKAQSPEELVAKTKTAALRIKLLANVLYGSITPHEYDVTCSYLNNPAPIVSDTETDNTAPILDDNKVASFSDILEPIPAVSTSITSSDAVPHPIDPLQVVEKKIETVISPI
jgi:hypothetical protein